MNCSGRNSTAELAVEIDQAGEAHQNRHQAGEEACQIHRVVDHTVVVDHMAAAVGRTVVARTHLGVVEHHTHQALEVVGGHHIQVAEVELAVAGHRNRVLEVEAEMAVAEHRNRAPVAGAGSPVQANMKVGLDRAVSSAPASDPGCPNLHRRQATAERAAEFVLVRWDRSWVPHLHVLLPHDARRILRRYRGLIACIVRNSPDIESCVFNDCRYVWYGCGYSDPLMGWITRQRL